MCCTECIEADVVSAVFTRQAVPLGTGLPPICWDQIWICHYGLYPHLSFVPCDKVTDVDTDPFRPNQRLYMTPIIISSLSRLLSPKQRFM